MNIKRIIALLLIVVLFVCIIPANAFAAQLRICDAEDYRANADVCKLLYPGINERGR